jgi:cellulose synthase/poly-beta-1,6-N-acetylglucosamine synthase-like glycosyltransferase
MSPGLLILAGLTVISIAFPLTGIVLCGMMFALQLSLIIIRLVAGVTRQADRPMSRPASQPIFSVHVATHNEPPDMVIATIHALLSADWPNEDYEVIVMDNNTSDKKLWKPVEAFCRASGPNCRFLHREDVEGAKAGALNIAFEHTRPDATHIITVDADYVVVHDFLIQAADAIARTGADYVQFPQAYADSRPGAQGIAAELKEYFQSRARTADSVEAVLLTGTLCVISTVALEECGGWSGATTTEDAELGVRLCQRGYTGRFIPRIVGTGLLPFCLRDLEKQRYRWSSGNLQTLMLHLPSLVCGGSRLDLHKRLAILSQLTAWLNFSLLPAAVVLTTLLLDLDTGIAVSLASATIVIGFFDIFWRLAVTHEHRTANSWSLLSTLASRFALAPISAKATFDILVGAKLPFIVTNKDPWAGAGQLPLGNIVLAILSVLALPAAAEAGLLTTIAVLILILPLPSAWITDRALESYRRFTAEASIGSAAG